MKILAIIPERSWSRNLPMCYAANLKVGGVTLIERAIQAADSSHYITKTIVAAESSDVIKLASMYDVDVVKNLFILGKNHKRSTTTLTHIMFALFWLAQYKNYKPDIIVLLQLTSPLTTGADIDSTIKLLLDNKADTSVSVSGKKDFRRYKPQDYLSKIDKPEDGAIYVNTWNVIMNLNTMAGPKIVYYDNPHGLNIDKIDDISKVVL
jgi:CMP-N-acetylneuraminic acid synthetase